jgi:hypothetical protein
MLFSCATHANTIIAGSKFGILQSDATVRPQEFGVGTCDEQNVYGWTAETFKPPSATPKDIKIGMLMCIQLFPFMIRIPGLLSAVAVTPLDRNA